MALADLVGTWHGTNGFRLMPDDPLAEYPATMTVTPAAGTHLTLLAYTWEHPVDGPQEGMLVVGSGGEAGSLQAMWADTWHQQPAPRWLPGHSGPGERYGLEAEYGDGWRWRITLEVPGPDQLRMRMDNVLPESRATPELPDGAYAAMVMDLRRA